MYRSSVDVTVWYEKVTDRDAVRVEYHCDSHDDISSTYNVKEHIGNNAAATLHTRYVLNEPSARENKQAFDSTTKPSKSAFAKSTSTMNERMHNNALISACSHIYAASDQRRWSKLSKRRDCERRECRSQPATCSVLPALSLSCRVRVCRSPPALPACMLRAAISKSDDPRWIIRCPPLHAISSSV